MISRLGLAISRVFERTAPDPFVLAILLTIVTAVIALTCGVYPDGVDSIPHRAEFLLDAWRDGGSGIWRLLSFSMQMCLVLVTGHALATAGPVRELIHAAANLPKSTASGAAMVALAACACGLLNWGLGLIVGALLAREVGRCMLARRIACHQPLLVAAGYTAMLIWHGGLSGSAPLSMSTAAGASKVLPAEIIAQLPDGVPLSQTIFSSMNMFVCAGLLVLIPATMALLAPKRAEDCRFVDDRESVIELPPAPIEPPRGRRTLPEYLETSPLLAWLLAIGLLAATIRFAGTSTIFALGLNEINAVMLALGLLLHSSPRAYMHAAEQGVRGCTGIIIQFPLYAGIMAMMESSGLVRLIAGELTERAGEQTLPLWSFVSAGVINLFIPSGGGQWAVQGPIALEAGRAVGVAPGTMIMSIAYGDQLTNMLQPFWALPLLAITGAKARDIVGYTSIAMIVAGTWMALGLVIF